MAHKIHKLKAFLKGKDRALFAKQLDITPGYLNLVVAGHRRASVDLALNIEAATYGEVSFKDVLVPSDDAPAR